MYEKSIELLNKAVGDEMSAVHQYMYFHFHCDDQGYDPLSNLFRQTAIEEMMHVEHLAERILFLKGEVQMAATEEVTRMRTRPPRSCSRIWSPTRSGTSTSTIPSASTWRSSASSSWPCSPSSAAREVGGREPWGPEPRPERPAPIRARMERGASRRGGPSS
jgi:Mn-containing catalase